jgi:hypothetical protein
LAEVAGREALRYPAAVTVGLTTVLVLIAVTADPDTAAAAALLALVVATVGAGQLLRGRRGAGPGTLVARVRCERGAVSRCWLHVTTPDGDRYLPVFFHPGLLGLRAGDTVAGQPISGRVHRRAPRGSLVYVPDYSASALAARRATVTGPRRRLLIDAPLALAGLAPAGMWAWALTLGPVGWAIAAAVGLLGGYWVGAVVGTDPS